MIRLLNIIFWVGMFSPCVAQELKGFYAGELKLAGKNIRMNVQLDLIEDSGNFKGVVRTRYVENAVVSGCENWVEGKLQNGNLVLVNEMSLRETEVPEGACSSIFSRLRLSVKNSPGQEPELSGNWFDGSGEVFGKVQLTRMDTVLSFTIAEEEEKAIRHKKERRIFMAENDSVRLVMMKELRGVNWIDTTRIKAKEASLLIKAPNADPYHKLTLLMNDQPLIFNTAPRKQGVKVTLREMEPGEVQLVFLCFHAMVEVIFDIEVTITWGDQNQKTWTIPVSTYQNRGLILNFLAPD